MDKNLDSQPNDKNLVLAWFNPDIGGYDFYQPTGELIRFGLNADISIYDNWGNRDTFAEATMRFLVRIVNENPEKKHEQQI